MGAFLRGALGGGGLLLVLGAFALGAAPSVWLGLSLLGAKSDLVDCANERAGRAEAETQHLLDEATNLNTEARRLRQEAERIREGSDAFRQSLAQIDFTCDLEPVADSVQQRLDEVRSNSAGPTAP